MKHIFGTRRFYWFITQILLKIILFFIIATILTGTLNINPAAAETITEKKQYRSPDNYKNPYISPETILAIRNGNIKAISKLSQKQPMALNSDTNGHTLLMAAVYYGSIDIVKFLLKKGADPTAIDKAGLSVYHYLFAGTAKKKTRLLKLICDYQPGSIPLEELKKKYDLKLMTHVEKIEAERSYGVSPKVTAIDSLNTRAGVATKKGYLKFLKQVLEKGADINTTDYLGAPLLTLAIIWNRKEIINYLLEKGADVNILTKELGKSPLYYAALFGHRELVQRLIEKGANARHIDNGGATPLHAAALSGRLIIATILVNNGVDVNAKTVQGGYTALYCATFNLHDEILRLLISMGGDVNIPANNGNTPLHYAAQHGRSNLAETLLIGDADVNAKGRHGVTPLHLAVIQQYGFMVDLLLKNGAKPDIADEAGKTPLFWAARWGEAHLLERMLKDVKGRHSDMGKSELSLLTSAMKCDAPVAAELLSNHQGMLRMCSPDQLKWLHPEKN